MFGPSGLVMVVVMMMMMVVVVVGSKQGALATTALPLSATEVRPRIKMVTPTPRPESLMLLKDCPVYVLGELRGVKKHGETWLNDGSACEMCRCVNGQKRCYYHYCNERLTEGFITPPSGRPPLDDEDREEGSGHPPLPDDYYKVVNHINDPGSWDVGESEVGRNEAQHPPMCDPPCNKFCPWGFKLDKGRGCLRCKCHKCPSLAQCQMRCLGGLAKDARGCRVCQCRSKGLALLPSHNHPTTPHQGGRMPPDTHTQEPCNDTSGGESGHSESGWGDSGHHGPGSTRDPDSLHHRPSSDGTTKSAVQASPVEWWQVWVIATPLVLVCGVVCGAVMRYWRRYHHDKYRINAYRHTETEKLRPVTTAEDHQPHLNRNLCSPHL